MQENRSEVDKGFKLVTFGEKEEKKKALMQVSTMITLCNIFQTNPYPEISNIQLLN